MTLFPGTQCCYCCSCLPIVSHSIGVYWITDCLSVCLPASATLARCVCGGREGFPGINNGTIIALFCGDTITIFNQSIIIPENCLRTELCPPPIRGELDRGQTEQNRTDSQENGTSTPPICIDGVRKRTKNRLFVKIKETHVSELPN